MNKTFLNAHVVAIMSHYGLRLVTSNKDILATRLDDLLSFEYMEDYLLEYNDNPIYLKLKESISNFFIYDETADEYKGTKLESVIRHKARFFYREERNGLTKRSNYATLTSGIPVAYSFEQLEDRGSTLVANNFVPSSDDDFGLRPFYFDAFIKAHELFEDIEDVALAIDYIKKNEPVSYLSESMFEHYNELKSKLSL